MKDEFDFSSSSPKPEDPTWAAQNDNQPEEPVIAAEASVDEAESAGVPIADAEQKTEPETQQETAEDPSPKQPEDNYQNPFAPSASAVPQQPYTPYTYTQPRQTYPPYMPQQPNAQHVPYAPPAAPYSQQNSVPPYTAQQQTPQPPYAAAQQPYTAPSQGYQPYPQNYWYAQPNRTSQNGAVPPVPPTPGTGYPYVPQPSGSTPKKKKSSSIVLWILAAVLEAVIVGFAIYGVYALCTGGNSVSPDVQRPGYNQQLPGQQGNGDTNSGSNDESGTSSAASNYTNVQLGIVCIQMKDEVWTKYNLDPGLMVQSISDDSNAKSTELQEGDVITSANGTSVKSFEDLFAIMDQMNPGDEITLTAYHLNTTESGYTQSESFTVKFAVKEKSTTTSSQETSDYPQA